MSVRAAGGKLSSSAREVCEKTMAKAFGLLLLLTLGACTAVPSYEPVSSPCAASEASYACQVERYHNTNM